MARLKINYGPFKKCSVRHILKTSIFRKTTVRKCKLVSILKFFVSRIFACSKIEIGAIMFLFLIRPENKKFRTQLNFDEISFDEVPFSLEIFGT